MTLLPINPPRPMVPCKDHHQHGKCQPMGFQDREVFFADEFVRHTEPTPPSNYLSKKLPLKLYEQHWTASHSCRNRWSPCWCQPNTSWTQHLEPQTSALPHHKLDHLHSCGGMAEKWEVSVKIKFSLSCTECKRESLPSSKRMEAKCLLPLSYIDPYVQALVGDPQKLQKSYKLYRTNNRTQLLKEWSKPMCEMKCLHQNLH